MVLLPCAHGGVCEEPMDGWETFAIGERVLYAEVSRPSANFEEHSDIFKRVEQRTWQECVTRIVQNRAFGGAHCPHCRSNISSLASHWQSL